METASKKRLNLRLDASLLLWAKTRAKKKHTTLTQMVVDHLTKLREQERQETTRVQQF